ncbi:hypothetical protein BASA81_004089 [Batrachochytrium salamandrivorans]|nr:hypothetical protein BASA81_004089 [Batrachochytrium salamandrivorans]
MDSPRLSLSAHSSPSRPSHYSFDERFTQLLSNALLRLAKTGTRRQDGSDDEFSTKKGDPLASIPLAQYLRRIFQYCNYNDDEDNEKDGAYSPSAQALVCTLVYIDRIVRDGKTTVHLGNVHRLLAMGMLLAFKMNEDFSVPMPLFAKITGIPLYELGVMELKMLQWLGFCATVSKQEYDSRLAMFVHRMRPRPL